MSGYDRIFLSNSGTEANEGAIKLCRKWGFDKNKTEMIAFTGGFHGRTYGPLSLMDKPTYKENMGPWLDGMKIVKFNDCDELERNVSEKTAGIMLEFIQGEGGLTEVTTEFIEKINELKEKYYGKNAENKTQISPNLTITRAVGISKVIDRDKRREIENFADICDFLLFDYEIQGKTGGTGKQIPAKTAIKAAKIAKNRNKNVKLTLAGGMNTARIKNEGKQLEKVFDAFDINSGVEIKPGVKNIDKISELMEIKQNNQ
jgi:phosphoribosylanthranilate isomerase